MIRISKGGITLACETQADVRLALGVFSEVDVPALPEMSVAFQEPGVASTVPDWRVGGPSPHNPTGAAYLDKPMTADLLETVEAEKPKLVAVPDQLTEYEANHPMPQHIPVSACNLEVLEAIMLFPDGVPTKGLQELLGLKQTTVSGRVESLKHQSLIERVPHHNLWRATLLARRAKLVRA